MSRFSPPLGGRQFATFLLLKVGDSFGFAFGIRTNRRVSRRRHFLFCKVGDYVFGVWSATIANRRMGRRTLTRHTYLRVMVEVTHRCFTGSPFVYFSSQSRDL